MSEHGKDGGSMGRGTRIGRIAAAATVALAGMALAAATANASFHLVKVREVATNPAGAESSFIELQMYAGGQNLVASHEITSYTAVGGVLGTSTLPANVPNGDNQRTVLVGDTGAAGSPDYVDPVIGDYLSTIAAGGAVCWETFDCVSWGGFTGVLPSPPGNPAPAIPAGSSLERLISPNCPTLLEDADDTNNSIVDFAIAPPSPRNNATTPTETACSNPGGGPDTKIDKGPKKKTKKKKATFEFSSTTAGTTFECSVDGKTFAPCTSPFEVKVKKGKHEFEVRAVLAGVHDGSPADQSWKVKKPKK